MRVATLVVAVGDDDLRALAPDDRHQPAGGLVDVGLVEAVGMVVRLGVGHARVAVAEHLDHVEADDLRGRGQLRRPHRGDHGLLLLGCQPVERLARLAQRRVLEVALLAAGAAHQHGVHALVVVARQRRRPLRRFVVGVGVHGEQREAFGHPAQAIGGDRAGEFRGHAAARSLRRVTRRDRHDLRRCARPVPRWPPATPATASNSSRTTLPTIRARPSPTTDRSTDAFVDRHRGR